MCVTSCDLKAASIERDMGVWKEGNKLYLRIMSRRKFRLWFLGPVLTGGN